jgi:hypothetical protein
MRDTRVKSDRFQTEILPDDDAKWSRMHSSSMLPFTNDGRSS